MQVHEGSPADKNGVRPGDSVVALNGIPVKSASQVLVQTVLCSCFYSQYDFCDTFCPSAFPGYLVVFPYVRWHI